MLWVVISNGVLVAYQFLQLVFISRFFGGSAVGDFGYALAVVSPIQIFWMANLKALVQSSSFNDDSLSILYTGRFIQVLFFIASVAFSLVFVKVAVDLVVAIAFAKSLEMMFDLRNGFYIRCGNFRRLAFNQCLRVAVMASCFVTVAIYMQSVFAGVCAGVVAAIPLLVYESRGLLLLDSIESLLASLRNVFGDIPLGLVAVCESLLALLPRLVLMDKVGAAAVGVFTVTYYLISAFNVFVQGFSVYFARRYFLGVSGVSGPIMVIAALGFLMVLLSWWCGDVFIGLVFGVKVSGIYVGFVVLSGVFAYLYVFIYGVTVDRLPRLVTVVAFLSVLYASYLLLQMAAGLSEVAFSFSVALTRMMQLLALIVIWMLFRYESCKS